MSLARNQCSDIICSLADMRKLNDPRRAMMAFESMWRTIKRLRFIVVCISLIALAMFAQARNSALKTSAATSNGVVAKSAATISQSGCPLIFPDHPVAVAPNQPAVADRSTVGIVNALCDVTLDFIGCEFPPTSVTLGCDTNGDGVSDLTIPLKNITIINRLFFQATIPALASSPGTGFPLACCGGVAGITLTRNVGAGDDNVFGPFTETLTCSIDLGIRAPVVISATPSEGDCALGQNLLIPGSCFLLADGKPNVTSVFAVEIGNPANVIQAASVHILTSNLIDAFFQIGAASAGKTFLIFASGPNGTSRNLTALPPGAPIGCPLGNEQGVAVTFKCKSNSPGPADTPPPLPDVLACRLDRTATGAFTLTLSGKFQDGGVVSIGGVSFTKVKLKGFDSGTNRYSTMIVKGQVCSALPGNVVYTPPDSRPSSVLQCTERCTN